MKYLRTTFAASVVAAVSFHPTDASAFKLRSFPLTMCQAQCQVNLSASGFACGDAPELMNNAGSNGQLVSGQLAMVGVNNFEQGTVSHPTGALLQCGVISDTLITASTSVQVGAGVNAYVNNADNPSGVFPLSVFACRTFGSGGGGTCGAETDWTGHNQVANLVVNDLSAWNGAQGDQYWLSVMMSNQDREGSSTVLFSYYIDTNQ